MKKVVLMMMTFLTCFGTIANADTWCTDTFYSNDGFYAEVFGGANFIQATKDDGVKPIFNVGYNVSGCLGYYWNNGLQLEFEYAYRRNSIKKLHFFGQDFKVGGHLQSSAYMANAFWNFSFSSCYLNAFSGFLGLGAGGEIQQFHSRDDGFSLKDDNKGFAWQAMLGVEYAFTNNFSLTAEYKFHKGPSQHIFNHTVGVGLVYKFGGCGCYEDCL